MSNLFSLFSQYKNKVIDVITHPTTKQIIGFVEKSCPQILGIIEKAEAFKGPTIIDVPVTPQAEQEEPQAPQYASFVPPEMGLAPNSHQEQKIAPKI